MTQPWLLTASGHAVDLLAPTPDQIALRDIATGLLAPRFNRQTHTRPWSIAEHSMLVADLVRHTLPAASPALILHALLHDAHEAYSGDIVSPMQHALALAGGARPGPSPLETIQHGLDAAIFAKFGLAPSDGERVFIKRADRQALGLELQAFMPRSPRPLPECPSIRPGFVLHRPLRTEAEIYDRFTEQLRRAWSLTAAEAA